MDEYAGEIKGDKFVFDILHRRRFDQWAARQKHGSRWLIRVFRESGMREVSQNNAHWERCTILGATEEISAPKEIVSDMLMEDAFIHTQNLAYGKYQSVFGVQKFIPCSTGTLTKDEFWELKRAAYRKLLFINDGKPENEFTKFPERGQGGLILRWCALWEERPTEENSSSE